MSEGIPECTALRLDPGTRRSDAGRTLIGGSPLRMLRVTDAGVALVDDLAAGGLVGSDPVRQRLARRLLDAGLAHPVPPTDAPDLRVGLVIPVRDDPADLDRLLDRPWLPEDVVVVDDGSRDPGAIARAVDGRAELVRRPTSGGPGAARDEGWRRLDTDLVAFVDADVVPDDEWLTALIPHFADAAVAAVAPRVHAREGRRAIDRYEAHRSPLDLGSMPARVAPGSRVSYLPTAAILYRRSILLELDGFDPELRIGEDVDLVWRTMAAGHTVRYEPSSAVAHRNRATWRALARQRHTYGRAAAALDARHPGAVAPLVLDPWSATAWLLPVVGGPAGAAGGLAVAAGSTVVLARRLRGRVTDPGREALRIAGRGHLGAGRWLAQATARAWLPLAIAASAVSRRARRATALALVGPPVIEWSVERPAIDPIRWTLARLLDDAAYCTGVWRGCIRHRSWGALRPRRARSSWS